MGFYLHVNFNLYFYSSFMKNRFSSRVCFLLVVSVLSIPSKTIAQVNQNANDVDIKVEELLSKMTLEEKVGQLN